MSVKSCSVYNNHTATISFFLSRALLSVCVWVSRRASSLHKPLKVLLVKSATQKRVQDCTSLIVFKCPLSLLGFYQAQMEPADSYR